MSHACHPAMATYLADLEARHGVPIRYQRWSSRYADRAPFKKEVELHGPYTGLPSDYALPYKDEVRNVQVVHQIPQTGERFELAHADVVAPVAAVDGRRVVLAFDLERLFESPQGDLQPGLVLDAVLGLALPKAIANIETYAWTDETARFVDWNVQGVDSQLATWKQNIKDNDFELDRLTSAAASIVRKNGELREQMRAVGSLTKVERAAKARDEFKALLKMVPDPVQSVDLDYGRLVVILQPITLENDGYDYDMGVFTLQISADNVRIWSDRGLRYPHPHVSSDGVPCWGNLGPHVARLLGERQYAALVATIVQFLHSYNERDAYRRIETWDPDYNDDE